MKNCNMDRNCKRYIMLLSSGIYNALKAENICSLLRFLSHTSDFTTDIYYKFDRYNTLTFV